MLSDITLEELNRVSLTALGKILNTCVTLNEAGASGNERRTACLRFIGELNGYIAILMKESEIPIAVDMIIKRFGIGVPVEDDLVFSEFINIFAGNVITELTKTHNINISVAVPEKDVNIDEEIIFNCIVSLKTEKTGFQFQYNLKT